jgi:serine protease
MRHKTIILAAICGGVWLSLAPVRARDEARWLEAEPPSTLRSAHDYVPGQLIVRFRDAVDERSAALAMREVGGRVARRAAFGRHFRVTLDHDVAVEEAVARLRTMGEVDYAEPNRFIRKLQGTTLAPNDPFFRLQWNMRLIGASRTWGIQQGRPEVAIAVLDTGVAYEDFGPYRKAPDWGSVRFLPGFDALYLDGHANDDEIHGTHVASTVAEATNNQIDVTGLAFGCSIMPVKVLDQNGEGTAFEFADGMDYVIGYREGGTNPVRVINLSLGFSESIETVRRAVDRATQAGILVVAAAGNDGTLGVSYPAAYDNVLAVGAVDGRKQRARYSNFGPELDVVAPGGDNRRDDDGDGIPDFIFQQTIDPDALEAGRYDEFTVLGVIGTSQATPHVSALAALLFSQGIGDSSSVRAAIEQNAEDLGPAGRDDEYGHGLIQPAKALSGLGLNK